MAPTADRLRLRAMLAAARLWSWGLSRDEGTRREKEELAMMEEVGELGQRNEMAVLDLSVLIAAGF